MASLKTIRKRIISVKSTQKITRAMKMVAGARLTRAQQRIVALRPYAVKTNDVLSAVAASAVRDKEDKEASANVSEQALHPLLVRRAEKRVLLLVMSSDRGLCGAFNTNICKAVERTWREKEAAGVEVVFATVGKKAREFIQRRNGKVVQDFQRVHEGLDLAKVKLLSDWIVPRFRSGEFDAVYIVFNEFKSALTQKTCVDSLLPLKESDSASAPTQEYEFEPDRDGLLEKLVPMYIDVSIYRALLDSQASEFGARMSAMDAATRNAKDMIGRLTLVYNRARQAGITKELMEIVGGAEALKE
jgi:F-type H+-transporting ATPase subunit gamma